MATAWRLILSFLYVALLIVTWPVAFIFKLHGFELQIGHSHKATPCPLGCGEFHDPGDICRLQKVGDCDICGTVDLDYFGNCAPAGHRWRFHTISNRRPKPLPQLTLIKGGPA